VLSEYPVELCVTCNRYILFIIAYEGYNNVTFVSHYIAYIKTGRKWFYYDNNLRKGKLGIVDKKLCSKVTYVFIPLQNDN